MSEITAFQESFIAHFSRPLEKEVKNLSSALFSLETPPTQFDPGWEYAIPKPLLELTEPAPLLKEAVASYERSTVDLTVRVRDRLSRAKLILSAHRHALATAVAIEPSTLFKRFYAFHHVTDSAYLKITDNLTPLGFGELGDQELAVAKKIRSYRDSLLLNARAPTPLEGEKPISPLELFKAFPLVMSDALLNENPLYRELNKERTTVRRMLIWGPIRKKYNPTETQALVKYQKHLDSQLEKVEVFAHAKLAEILEGFLTLDLSALTLGDFYTKCIQPFQQAAQVIRRNNTEEMERITPCRESKLYLAVSLFAKLSMKWGKGPSATEHLSPFNFL